MSKERDLSNSIDAYLNKAKPKVLKPGSPAHTKAMAEMDAIKAAKPKSTNPAGEEHPSAPGSRDKLGDRPLVGGLDKQSSEEGDTAAGQRAVGDPSAGTGAYMVEPGRGGKGGWGGDLGRKLGRVVGGLDKQIENVVEPIIPASTVQGVRDRKKKENEQRAKDAAEGKGVVVTDHSVKKSMDLEEPSRSWSYQG